MSAPALKRVLVVAGLGDGSGTGAAVARLFSKSGFSIALVARGQPTLDKLSEEIRGSGGNVASFPVGSYSADDIHSAWESIRAHYSKPQYVINTVVFNIGSGVFKKFLDVKPEDIKESLDTNVAAAFHFSRGAILAFKDNEIDTANGKRGTLIFTGATASLRGNVFTSAFAAGKFGSRALSQSLAKEFGQENIHVAHAIIDGAIATKRQRDNHDPEWGQDGNIRLSPESIAAAYLYLSNQDRSAMTWELDLRPAHEKW